MREGLLSFSHTHPRGNGLNLSNRIQTTHVALAVVLVLAAGLRLWGITDRGVYDYDEAWYLLEAKTLHYTGDYLLSKVGLSDADTSLGLKAYVKQHGTVPMTSVKPGHTILTFLGMVVVGTGDYAGLGVSALSGTLTVLLVFLLGRQIGGTRLGLASALILAVSPLHVHYSRSMYSQANGVFLATLGAYLWTNYQTKEYTKPWRLLGAGLAIGFAFTCHFNLAYVTVGFIAVEIVYAHLKRRPIYERITRVGILGFGMAFPAFCFETGGQIAKKLGLFPKDYPTYIGQFVHRQSLAEDLVLSTRQIPFWTDRLTTTEGILVAALFIVGTCVLIAGSRRPSLTEVTLIGMALMALAPPSLLVVERLYDILRNYAIALPVIALISGTGFTFIAAECAKWRRLDSTLAVVCILIILPTSYGRMGDTLDLRSGYRDASAELVSRLDAEDARLATHPPSAWPIWYFYLSNEYDDAPQQVRDRIHFYPEETQEGDFELVDVKSYYRAVLLKDHQALDRYARLRSSGSFLSLHNPAATIPEAFFEAGGDKAEAVREALAHRYTASQHIEIYDLRQGPHQAKVWTDNGDKG